jgi:DMSO/TMAO reductase YedYZ heme-binding membrane subunit
MAVGVILLLALQLASKRRLPRSLWQAIAIMVTVVVVLASVDLVPYYLWNWVPSRPIRLSKSFGEILFMLVLLLRFYGIWRRLKSDRASQESSLQ